jgi:nucleoside 2-deoxyribosyltransferase
MGHSVFDDWMGAGPEADDYWQKYEQARGRTYREALAANNAHHVFHYDLAHLSAAQAVVLVAPTGRSGHMELGWALGRGKPGFIYMTTEPERWDVMYLLADGICYTMDELHNSLETKK